MQNRVVTVFGGTGFLGRRLADALRRAGAFVRVASCHPERVPLQFGNDLAGLQALATDVEDDRAVAEAIAGAEAVVNAVSLYVEQGNHTFHAIHVSAAARIARYATERRVTRLVHVSGIGADAASHSPYIRSRGEGEAAVRAAFPAAIIVRPAVMVGPDDSFITVIAQLLRKLPAYPMFGHGQTRLQPVSVDDIAVAIARAVLSSEAQAGTYELGGRQVYAYADLVRLIAKQIGRRPQLLPLPFSVWHTLAALAEWLPKPPLTRNQVELMEMDNTAAPGSSGFSHLGLEPRPLENLLPEILGPS